MDVFEKINTLQNAIIEEETQKKAQNKKDKYHFDKLKMYFGEDYIIHGITVSMPMIGDILKIGEANFYQSLTPFINNPTSIRVMLYENFDHKDWTKTKDIEVFYILWNLLQNKEPLKLLFKDFSFENIQLFQLNEELSPTGEPCLALVDPLQNFIMTEDEYMELAEYIREMVNIHPKVEKIKGKSGKLWAIQEDKMNAAQAKKTDGSSALLPLVSACVNHPGFKYKLDELKEVNIYQFMDSVNRIQTYERSVAAIHGAFGGMVSGKDVQGFINFMGD